MALKNPFFVVSCSSLLIVQGDMAPPKLPVLESDNFLKKEILCGSPQPCRETSWTKVKDFDVDRRSPLHFGIPRPNASARARAVRIRHVIRNINPESAMEEGRGRMCIAFIDASLPFFNTTHHSTYGRSHESLRHRSQAHGPKRSWNASSKATLVKVTTS